MKMLTSLLLLISLKSYASNSKIEKVCKSTWIYFDLGNTLVNTQDGSDQLRYIEGAKEYIQSLKEAGCSIGLITNIPEAWGLSYNERIQKLKGYISKGWVDYEPFDWSLFDKVYIPPRDEDRKPNPVLFKLVHSLAWVAGKRVLYQGETLKEIEIAQSVGMKGYQVGSDSKNFFFPIDQLDD